MSAEVETSKENLPPPNKKARQKSEASKKGSTKEAAKSLPAKAPRSTLPPSTPPKTPTKTPKKTSKKTLDKADKAAKKAKQARKLQKSLSNILSRKEKGILVEVVDSWVEFYGHSRKEAMLMLINLLIQAAFDNADACLALESFVRFEDSDDPEVLEEILPISGTPNQRERIWLCAAKQKIDQNTRSHFLEFWKKLILQCQREILYDEYFIVQLFHWTLALSHSQSRPLRQTCNLVSLHIQSALLDVCCRLQNRLSVSERQLEVERTKNERQAVRDLRNLTKSIKGHIAELEGILDEVFAGQFEYRRKDVLPIIRADCVNYLGEWIQLYPSVFNKNNYLAILGWALSDKDETVRMASVKSLTAIYSYEKLLDQLDMFTEHFKGRMIQMPSDVDVNVAVQGIGLCTQLAKLNILNDIEISDLNSFVFDADGKIRIRAAQFISEYRLEHVVTFEFKSKQLNLPKKKGQKQQRRSEEHELAAAKLLSLIHLVQEEEELPDYLIDVLWGSCDVLHQWDVMTDLALDPSSDVTVTDQQMVILMDFITACVKRACGVKLVPRAKGEKVHIDSEQQIEEYRKQMTAHFLPVLPELLNKFATESEIIASLAEIPQYFYTEHLDVEGAANHFKDLRQTMMEIFQKTVDRDVLGKVATTMDVLSKQDNAFSKDTKADILDLLDWTFGKFKTNSLNLRGSESSVPSSKDVPMEKSATSLLVNLHRLNSFQYCRDIEPVFREQRSPYYRQLENLIEYITEKPEEQLLLYLFDAVQLTILWEYANFLKDMDSRTEEEGLPTDYDTILADFYLKVPAHVGVLQAFLKKGTDQVKERCFYLISDMLCAFNQVYATEMIVGVDYAPSEELTKMLCEEFRRKMEEVPEIDEEDTENTLIIAKEDYLAAFARVVAFGAISTNIKEFGPEVLNYIEGHGKTITKIVKAFLHHLRERNPAYRHTLSSLISSTLEKKYLECRAKDDFSDIVSLAKHLAAIFGIAGTGKDEIYQTLAYLFQIGFKFVATEPEFRQSYFTHAMKPFVSKLDPAAAGVLLGRFDLQLPKEDHDGDDYIDLITFRETLESLAGGNRKKATPGPKKRKGAPTQEGEGGSVPKKRKTGKGKQGTKRKSKDDPNPKPRKRRSGEKKAESESEEEDVEEPEPDTQRESESQVVPKERLTLPPVPKIVTPPKEKARKLLLKEKEDKEKAEKELSSQKEEGEKAEKAEKVEKVKKSRKRKSDEEEEGEGQGSPKRQRVEEGEEGEKGSPKALAGEKSQDDE